MTTQSTRHRAVAAAALLTATGLTLSGCNDGGAPPTDSTSTASGPSSSTMSQEEQDLADAVTITKAYYAAEVKEDLREPSRKWTTKRHYDGQVKYVKTVRARGWTWKGARNQVLWVKASERGQQQVTTRVCLQQNRLAYLDGKPVLVTQDGDPIKSGDRLQYLVTLVMEDGGWKIDSGAFEKKGC